MTRAAGEDGFTLVEMLVVTTITAVISTVLGAVFVVGVNSVSSTNVRQQASQDAQLVTAYFVKDVSSATYFSKTQLPLASTCAGALTSNVSTFAVMEWIQGVTKIDVEYVMPTSGVQQYSLIREYCTGGALQYSTILAHHLSTGATPVQVSCPAPDPDTYPNCSVAPDDVQMQLTWDDTPPFVYTLRASPRPDPFSSGGLGSTSLYVGGGGLFLHGTLQTTVGDIYIAGTTTCQGQWAVNPAGSSGAYYEPNAPTCGGVALPGTFGDPLANIATPLQPSIAAPGASTTSLCGTSQRTYYPGYYASSATLSSGCLSSGTYWFANGVTLQNITSAPGGVLIYVDQGAASINSSTIAPLSNGTSGGISLFMGRANTSPIYAIKSTVNVTVGGIIYAPNCIGQSNLGVQTPSGSFSAGGIDVCMLSLQANSSISIS